MTSKPSPMTKGSATEELLRRYFIKLGYFVVRGVPITVGGDDVTDIDLWLYNRHSPVARERVNVDIKNKQRAKAVERILVTRGIREAFGFDRSVVVTSDSRPVVVNFGHQSGVTVFGGELLSGLTEGHQSMTPRLTDEDLVALFNRSTGDSPATRWDDKLRSSKRLLVTSFGFDACNEWLCALPEYFEVAATNPHQREGALRGAYLIIAMFLASLDYAIAPIAFEGGEKRRLHILDGLKYGSEGLGRFERVAKHASELASAVANVPKAQFRAALAASLERDETRYAGLAELFGKGALANSLVSLARGFEALAYGSPFADPRSAPVDARAVLGALADALDLDRAALLA
jgi:hypothetical protein